MVDTWLKILIALSVGLFLAICYLWKKPLTDFGRLSRTFCAVNGIGWLILLPLSSKGHPPTCVLGAMGFGLLNLILLPAVAVLLWMCHKDRKERQSYLAIALMYVALNVIALYGLPIVGLVVDEIRH